MAAANAGEAFARVLVDELTRHGVTDAVLAPGSRSTPVALALADSAAIRLHVRIDERSAAYLAVGLARASGRVVPVLCTSGTAASYFLGAVMEADLSRLPLLVLTADRPPELRSVGANQTVDQPGMYGGAVRWACDVGVPESRADSVRYWRSMTSRAVAACTGAGGSPPGPVHLNLPLREPLTAVDDGVGFPYDLAGRGPADAEAAGPVAGPGEPWTRSAAAAGPTPRWLVDRVRRSRRGVLVAGDLGGAGAAGAAAVQKLAAAAGWPLIAEPHSGARAGPNALRCTDAVLRSEHFTAAHRPDLVLVAGRVGLSRALLGWLATVPHVVVDEHGSWWDVTRSAEAVVRCSLSALPAVEVSPADPDWLAGWADAAQRVATAVDAALDAAPGLPEPVVARDVASRMAADGALVVASSMPIRDLDLLMRPRPLRVLANRGVSGIDGFVSTAAGVALVHDGPTVALCGDLSLLHDVNGLLPGPDPRPDLTYVVINNDGGGIFSMLPQAADGDPRFERLFGTAHGMSLARLAEAYQVEHVPVSTPGELAAALPSGAGGSGSPAGGIRLVECRTDRAANATLHERLRAVAAAAVPT